MNRVAKRETKKKAKAKTKEKTGFGKIILILIFLIIICMGITFGIKVYKNGGGLQGLLAATLGQDMEKLQDLDTIYVLVLGVSEDLETKLTDTIILCGYNPKQQKATMLSIPRDTFVGKNRTSAKSGYDKINALYSTSPEKTMEAVTNITGIEVENYVVISNNALINMVDVIGGVEFYVPIDMDYDDKTQNLHIHLEEGLQNINGEEAEQLLRFRKNNDGTTYPSEYGADDYGRMRTQREFITETVKQTLQIKNVTKLKEITKAIFDNVQTNLSLEDVLPYIPWAVNFNIENINSKQLPGASDNPNGIWFFFHDKKETATLIEEMQNDINGIVEELDGNVVNNTTNSVVDKDNTSNTNSNSKKTNTTSKKTTNTSKK